MQVYMFFTGKKHRDLLGNTGITNTGKSLRK